MLQSSECEIFLYWIQEREAVRQKKESRAAKPWTSDELLRDYRWCNVRRMDDRVSQWLFNYWYMQTDCAEQQLLAATIGRLVNWPDSLNEMVSAIGFGSRLYIAAQTLPKRRDKGLKIFTGAYIVPGITGMDKVSSVLRTANKVSWEAPHILEYTMKGTWEGLKRIPTLGSFLAGQIVADMAHLKVGLDWNDRHTWAPLGPGSQRGINRLYGRPKNQAIKQEQFEKELPVVMELVQKQLPRIFYDRELQAMDIQNCLCEFDKYRRLQLKEGTVRSRYNGAPDSEVAALMYLLSRAIDRNIEARK